MAKQSPRNLGRRTRDAKRRLRSERNLWVATASPSGVPHLVPLSHVWVERISAFLMATPSSTPTARNIEATGIARASFGDTDDVIIVVAEAEITAYTSASPAMVKAFERGVGWGPSGQEDGFSLVTMRPKTILAWNGVDELDGRLLMRNGLWLDGQS